MKMCCTFTRLLSVLLLAFALRATAQPNEAVKGITQTVTRYYQSLGNRNVDVLKNLVEPTILVVESKRGQARTHVVDTSDPAKLLPPEGNRDWLNVTVNGVSVSLTGEQPSSATATYSVFRPLKPELVEAWEAELKSANSVWDQKQKDEITKLLKAKGQTTTEHAMLSFREGQWRIVSITFTKT
jgi:hypothetical protein